MGLHPILQKPPDQDINEQKDFWHSCQILQRIPASSAEIRARRRHVVFQVWGLVFRIGVARRMPAWLPSVQIPGSLSVAALMADIVALLRLSGS